MARYDGLIIPRAWNEYINKSDPVAMSQALQLSGVMDAAPTASSNKPVKSSGIYNAIGNKEDTKIIPATDANECRPTNWYTATYFISNVSAASNCPTNDGINYFIISQIVSAPAGLRLVQIATSNGGANPNLLYKRTARKDLSDTEWTFGNWEKIPTISESVASSRIQSVLLKDFTGGSETVDTINYSSYLFLTAFITDSSDEIIGTETITPTQLDAYKTLYIYGGSTSVWGRIKTTLNTNELSFNRTSASTTRLKLIGFKQG